MTNKRRLWLALAIAAAGGLAVWGIAAWRARQAGTPRAMLRRLRTRDAVVLSVDFAGLRQAGILRMLTASRVAEEPEYREFVRKTGFDYTTDLDLALVSFAPAGNFFVVRGRFDWPSLRRYAASQNGSCAGGLCRMQGSTPERRISFLPLHGNLMAMAVSRDDQAALLLEQPEVDGRVLEPPADPVWISVPGPALRSAERLPAGARVFARTLENSEGLTLSFGPYESRFAARLDVRCRTGEDASAMAASLERATGSLKEMLARERQAPSPRDLSGILTGGSFRARGNRVYGFWPVERAFVEETLGGAS